MFNVLCWWAAISRFFSFFSLRSADSPYSASSTSNACTQIIRRRDSTANSTNYSTTINPWHTPPPNAHIKLCTPSLLKNTASKWTKLQSCLLFFFSVSSPAFYKMCEIESNGTLICFPWISSNKQCMLSIQSFSLECVQLSRASDNVLWLYFILLRIWKLELTMEIFCSGSAGMCLSQLVSNNRFWNEHRFASRNNL